MFFSREFSPLSLSLSAYTDMWGVAPPSGSLEQIKKKQSRGFAHTRTFVAHNVRIEFLSLASVETSRIVTDT